LTNYGVDYYITPSKDGKTTIMTPVPWDSKDSVQSTSGN